MANEIADRKNIVCTTVCNNELDLTVCKADMLCFLPNVLNVYYGLYSVVDISGNEVYSFTSIRK